MISLYTPRSTMVYGGKKEANNLPLNSSLNRCNSSSSLAFPNKSSSSRIFSSSNRLCLLSRSRIELKAFLYVESRTKQPCVVSTQDIWHTVEWKCQQEMILTSVNVPNRRCLVRVSQSPVSCHLPPSRDFQSSAIGRKSVTMLVGAGIALVIRKVRVHGVTSFWSYLQT